jgi:PAS domain S-box-containing protein
MRRWAATAADAAPEAGAPLAERVRVLVAGVPPDARKAVTHALARPGYAVHWTDGVDGAATADAYDVFVVGDPQTAQELLRARPHAAVVLLDDAAEPEPGVAEHLRDPDAAAVAGAVRRALARGPLAESEERLALALEGSGDGLWDWDVRTNRVHLSPRWKAMLGHGEDEIGDAPAEWLGRVHPDDRAPLTQALDAHMAEAGGAHFEFEHRVRHRDGDYRWMLARATTTAAPSGWSAPRPTSPSASGSSCASSTTPCTTA